MTNEIQTEIEIEAPEAAPATEEPTPMIVLQDVAPNGKKIFKTHGEEFTLAEDFEAIAQALSLTIDQVAFNVIDDTSGDIDGKALVGVPK